MIDRAEAYSRPDTTLPAPPYRPQARFGRTLPIVWEPQS